MSQSKNINNQEPELPKIKLSMGGSPEFVLTFKSENQKAMWIKQHKATQFCDGYLLLEGHLCLVQIEQPEPQVEPTKPAPRVDGAVGKSQSFTIDGRTGKMTRPF